MNNYNPTILVIVGVTGDLAKRKLLPACAALRERGMLPEQFHIIGVTRQHDVAISDILAMTSCIECIGDQLTVFQMDLGRADEYERLAARIADVEQTVGVPAQRLVYLSVPPTTSKGILEHLGTSGIVRSTQDRVLMEKPFGTDYTDAAALAAHLDRFIDQTHLYRVDHYLAKELVQDMLDRSPDTADIARIDIVASEFLGIEGRANFYEQTGALRDLVQSHLLQFAAAALYDPTSPVDRTAQRHEAFQSIAVVPESVVRGQYKGYREQVGNAASVTETFVSMTLHSTLPRYKNVPITISTGKHLDSKKTYIQYTYVDGTTRAFTDKPTRPAEAYEHIIHSAIVGHEDIFISSHDVLECWRIVAPIQQQWATATDDLILYEQGSTIDHILKKD